MKKLSIVLGATIIFALALSTESVAADPFTGTWRLDPSKTEDSNPYQITLASITNGISLQTNQQAPFVAYYNGKDYPIGTGNTINALRVNDRTLVLTTRRNGKILGKSTMTVSADGEHAVTVTEEPGLKNKCRRVIVGHRLGPAPSGDAFLGTWRQDPPQTKYDPPLTYILKVSDHTLDFTTNRLRVTRAKFDGKYYEQNTSDATLRLKRVDDHTIEVIQKNPLGPPTTGQWHVNGNMLIITLAGTGAEGKPFKQVRYLERIE